MSCCVSLLGQRDLLVIEEDVQRRQEEGGDLARRLPHVGQSVQERLKDVTLGWDSLQAKASQRRERLRQAEAVQKYLADWRQLTYVSLPPQLTPQMHAQQAGTKHTDVPFEHRIT